jgi:hypothetical protein
MNKSNNQRRQSGVTYCKKLLRPTDPHNPAIRHKVGRLDDNLIRPDSGSSWAGKSNLRGLDVTSKMLLIRENS